MDLLGGYESNNSDDATTTNKDDVAGVTKQKAQRADRRFLKAAPSLSIMTKKRHGNELIVRRDPNNYDLVTTEPIQGQQVDDPSTQQNKLIKFDLEKNAAIDPLSFEKERKK